MQDRCARAAGSRERASLTIGWCAAGRRAAGAGGAGLGLGKVWYVLGSCRKISSSFRCCGRFGDNVGLDLRGVLSSKSSAQRAGVRFAGLGERVVAGVKVLPLGQLLGEEVLLVW